MKSGKNSVSIELPPYSISSSSKTTDLTSDIKISPKIFKIVQEFPIEPAVFENFPSDYWFSENSNICYQYRIILSNDIVILRTDMFDFMHEDVHRKLHIKK